MAMGYATISGLCRFRDGVNIFKLFSTSSLDDDKKGGKTSSKKQVEQGAKPVAFPVQPLIYMCMHNPALLRSTIALGRVEKNEEGGGCSLLESSGRKQNFFPPAACKYAGFEIDFPPSI